MKKKQRKSYTAAFKVKIALEAIKGQRTINEIATHYGVHPNMVTQWKKQAIESLPDVFSTRRERNAQEDEGRFTSTDPAAIKLKHMIDPQDLNRYSYVANNPLAYIDPNGADKIKITVLWELP